MLHRHRELAAKCCNSRAERYGDRHALKLACPSSFLLLLSLLAGPSVAQTEKAVSVSAGFKLGAPISGPSNNNRPFASTTDGRWTGGPSLEVKLPYRLAVEIDALYRTRLFTNTALFTFSGSTHAYQFSGTTSTNAWDFPLLLKRRFQIGGGAALRQPGLSVVTPVRYHNERLQLHRTTGFRPGAGFGVYELPCKHVLCPAQRGGGRGARVQNALHHHRSGSPLQQGREWLSEGESRDGTRGLCVRRQVVGSRH